MNENNFITFKTHWEVSKDAVYYSSVQAYDVVFGHHHGSGRTDAGGSCSYGDFLNGTFQHDIKDKMGDDVLNEMIFAVENSKRNKSFNEQYKRQERAVENWSKIPINENLIEIYKNPDEDGRKYYKNGDNGITVSCLPDETKLVLKYNLEPDEIINPDGEVIQIKSQGKSSVIAYDNHFYVGGDGVAVIDKKGNTVYNRYYLKENYCIEKQLRIGNIMRKENTVICTYWNLGTTLHTPINKVVGDSGIVELSIDNLFISRAVLKNAVNI